MYDHRANGYSRGEGAACIVLKPLDEAFRNGDTIRGVIRNTGTNQDGKTNGITLPNSKAQESLMRSVYEGAGLDPLRTTYVEAHGTGTPAGDPLEAAAISKVFSPGRPSSQPLVVGSVKTNVGHLEGASGLVGLIKTVLMLENNLILPNVNFEKANPKIPLAELKLKVPTSVQSWPTSGVRRASVCNYGYGGSNAHVIIDDALNYLSSRGLKGYSRTIPKSVQSESKAILPAPVADRARVFVLSAADELSGKSQAKKLATYLDERQQIAYPAFLDDLAFTLSERRSILPWKVAVPATSIANLIESNSTDDIKFSKATKEPILGFVFTGQGAQWHAMGRELISQYPVFRTSLERSRKYLTTFGAEWSLLEELNKSAQDSQIGLGYLSQPLCTAVQIALVDLMASWNIKPSAVTGHSSGEIAAAYTAGALSQESALAVSYYRGLAAPAIKEMYPDRKGAMLAVGLSKEETRPLVSQLTQGNAVVACVNSPSSVTVSGDEAAIDELLATLQEKKIFARKLAVEIAYHSHHMDCIADAYLAHLQKLPNMNTPKAEFYSSVTGKKMKISELQPSYWVSNMLSPVEFADSLRSMCVDSSKRGREKAAVDILIEVGPHSALAGPIKQILKADAKLVSSSIFYSSMLVRKSSAVDTALQVAANLFERGYPVNFSTINSPSKSQHNVLVDLPTYAWNHSESFWAESRESKSFRSRSNPRTDILGSLVRQSIPMEPRWRNFIRPNEIPWVRDHKVQSNIIYPAGGFISMAIEAASQHAKYLEIPVSAYKLREITIGQALVVPENEVETTLCLRPYSESLRSSSDAWYEFRIYSVSTEDEWTEHCRGLVSMVTEETTDKDAAHLITAFESECFEAINMKQAYADLKSIGLEYGPSFAIMSKAQAAPYRCIGNISTYDIASIMPANFQYPFVVHPSTLDACIHALFPGMIAAEGGLEEPALPTFVEEVVVSARISSEPNTNFTVCAKSEKRTSRQFVSSIDVFSDNDITAGPMITFTGLSCSSIPKSTTENASAEAKQLCFKTEWAPCHNLLSSGQIKDFCESDEDSFGTYLSMLAHNNPHLNCLQIGTELGYAAVAVLGGGEDHIPQFGHYDIADASVEGLDDLKAAVSSWEGLVSFKKLNTEADLASQGFEHASYDLVLVSQADSQSIGCAGKLLNAGGRLVIKSPTLDEVVCFGILLDNGFEGVECVLQGQCIISKLSTQGAKALPDVTIITGKATSGELVVSLQEQLRSLGLFASVMDLGDADIVGKTCIVLSELSQSILSNPSSSDFDSLKTVLTQSNGALWVSRGAALDSDSPDTNMISGLVRTVRQESSTTIVTLDLDNTSSLDATAGAEIITRVFQTNFDANCKGEIDFEYAERNGFVMVPRVFEDKAFNEFISTTVGGPVLEEQPFVQSGRCLTVEMGTAGQLDSFRFVDDEAILAELPEECVDIEVKAVGINSRDVAIATAGSNSASLGCECSGIVIAVGKTVSSFKVGDRVVCHAQGAIRSVVRLQASNVQAIPEQISFESAAAMPIAYTTAHHALVKVASVEEDETVMVHSAASALGQAIISICQMIGAKVFAIVQSYEEKTFIMEQFKLQEDQIFSIQDNSFAKNIIKATNGNGVDVILNTASGEALRLSWECIAPFGRFVELASQNVSSNTRLEMGRFAKNVTLSAIDIHQFMTERPEQGMKTFAKVMALIQNGSIKAPQNLTTFSMSELEATLRTVQSGRHSGKVVLVTKPDELVNVVPRDTSSSLLRSDASYLLIGGLGGLGRAMATWMMSHGAKNFIFASRSGSSKQSAWDVVDHLQSSGANVAVYSCDVSNESEVSSMLSQCSESMPPIRGCIQAAMVIKNSFFQNMSLADYLSSTNPKVQGTWNLHNYLPRETLDFFILLSSTVGSIGNASQAAYAAASTFQDSFASYRSSLGLPCISLDLGMINDIGYVAENSSVQKGLEKLGFEGVGRNELMALLHHSILYPTRSPTQASTITGLGTYKPTEAERRPALQNPRFSHFRRQGEILAPSSSSSTQGLNEDIRTLLTSASSLDDANQKLLNALVKKTSTLLMVPIEDISIAKPMVEYGMDSLVAVQMRAWILTGTDVTVSILELISNVSLKVLAGKIVGRCKIIDGMFGGEGTIG